MRWFVIAAALLSASAGQADDFFGVKVDVLEKQNQKLENIYNNTQHGNSLLEEMNGNVKTLLGLVKPPAAPAADLVIDIDVPLMVGPPAVEGSVTKIRSTGMWLDPDDRKWKKMTFAGSAVADGDGSFRTVSHLTDGMRAPLTVEVLAGDEWKACSYQSTPGVDHAVARLPGHKIPVVKTRKPKYLETVWVYGMKTQEMKKGRYTSLGIVSLDQWVHGTDQGDSGGGVFSAEGELVGTLRGYQKNLTSAVTFTEVGEESFVEAKAPAKPAPAAAAPSPCANGQCPAPKIQWYYQNGRRK